MNNHSWTRMPGEPSDAYTSFMVYLKDESRSIHKLLEDESLVCARRTAYRWQERWQWAERAGAYDLYVTSKWTRAKVKRLERAQERISDITDTFLAKLEASLSSVDPTRVSPAQIANWFKVIAELQLKVLGHVDAKHVTLDGRLEIDEDVTAHERLADKLKAIADAHGALKGNDTADIDN